MARCLRRGLPAGRGGTAGGLEDSSGVHTGGLSGPSPQRYESVRDGGRVPTRLRTAIRCLHRGRFGCIVYSMATQWLPADQTAQTEVRCQQWPPSDLDGLTPVVFRLEGSAVDLPGLFVDADGYLGVLDVIGQYFLRQLWNEASRPKVGGESHTATRFSSWPRLARCGLWPVTGKCSRLTRLGAEAQARRAHER